MRRYRGFVDMRTIQRRMDAKDRRFQQTGRSVASSYAPAVAQLFPTSQAPARYLLGDEVEVTNDAHVGEREVVLARGIIEAVNGEYPDQLYFVQGVELAQRATTLRLILRGR